MKEYQVSFYLDNMYHCYIEEALNEAEAITRAINRMYPECKKHLHDFKIKRYFQEWN